MVRVQKSNRAFFARVPSAGLTLVVLALLGLSVTALAPPSMSDRLDAIIQQGDAEAAFWGIYVQDLTTGRVIYERNADKTFVPASTQKLITAAVALDALSSSYRYQTTLHFAGTVDGAVMRGDLILEGSGDPTFGSVDVEGEDPLRSWARQLAEMGVQRIEGRIIGDDDVFDDDPYAKGWDIDYVTNQASRKLGISTSGLSYHDNVVELQVRATRVGAAPAVKDTPPGYLDIVNRATTNARRRGRAIRTDRMVGSEAVVVGGSVPRTYRGTVFVPVADPTAFTLHAFRAYLKEAGIEVEAGLVDVDDLPGGVDYSEAKPLLVHLSQPLSRILEVLNKESNNFYAEQIFRTFSWGGAADGGERRVKAFLSQAGVPVDGLSVRDGSGLSRKDMITPEAMGQLLSVMYTHPEHTTFLASLAQGGERESTLRHRLQTVPVQAKTGSLEYVRALCGYTVTSDGRPIAFVLFANNYSVPSYRITRAIDALVTAMTTEAVG
jgi:D-alanyl-D-alanine carboxypeptidase/D-alanyl-D-alanine-endopeptidase (penicillin-binding protein 4)